MTRYILLIVSILFLSSPAFGAVEYELLESRNYCPKTDYIKLRLTYRTLVIEYEDIIPTGLTARQMANFIESRLPDYEFFIIREVFPDIVKTPNISTMDDIRTWVNTTGATLTPRQLARIRTQRLYIERKQKNAEFRASGEVIGESPAR